MNLPTWYDAGTVSVATGSAIVTGFNNFWGDDAIMAGDLFCDPAQPLIPPQRVKSAKLGELELWTRWPGAPLVQAPYEVRYVGIIERSTAQTRKVLEELGQVSAWYDIMVEDNAARLALETANNPLRANYRVLVKNPGVIWVKKSGAFGDWIGPVEFRGPIGQTPTVTAGPTTTLAPDQPAKVTPVAIPGGVRLDFEIPRGPTGDINGVTPFWNTRLGSDGDAAAARAGLEAQQALGFAPVQQGTGIGQTVNDLVKIGWSAVGRLKATVNNSDRGSIWTDADNLMPVNSPTGYTRMPSGLIVQWGRSTQPIAEYQITFPTAFPTANIFQMTAVWGNYDTTTMYAVTADSPYDTSAFAVRKWLARNGGVVSKNADAFTVVWLAVGF